MRTAVMCADRNDFPISEEARIRVACFGAGRGFIESLVRAYDRLSMSGARLSLTIYDAVAGRAQRAAEQARRPGIEATAYQAHAEDVVASDTSDVTVVQVDSANSIVGIIRGEIEKGSANGSLIYLLIDRPGRGLSTIRCVIPPGDTAARRSLLALFEVLAGLGARGGSIRVVGSQAAPGNQLSQALHRQRSADHLVANLPKFAAGLEPESPMLEIDDGAVSLPATVLDDRAAERDPDDAARAALAVLDSPLPWGEELAVFQLLPDDRLRLITAKRDARDGRLLVYGNEAPGREEHDDDSRRASSEAQRDVIRRIGERNTNSKERPIPMTD